MNETVRSELVEPILAVLRAAPGHAPEVRPLVDICDLTGLEIGRLWGAVHRAQWSSDVSDAARKAAQSIANQVNQQGRVLMFDEPGSVAFLSALTTIAWRGAFDHLRCTVCLPSAAMVAELHRLVGSQLGWTKRTSPIDLALALPLVKLADASWRTESLRLLREHYAASRYRVGEIDALAAIGASAKEVLAAISRDHDVPFGDDSAQDPAVALAGDAAYADFARAALEGAVADVEAIHCGVVAYKPDAVFSIDDATVLARAARVASYRDEEWFRNVVGRLLPAVCLAPTAAKTMPSQSLTVALGHSIEAAPTPESVGALRQALAIIRHVGVKKKLARNLKPAERALGATPAFALRLVAPGSGDKKRNALLAVSLEAGFWQGMRLAKDEWRKRLVDMPGANSIASHLVWAIAGERRGFMVHSAAGTPLSLLDVNGDIVECADQASVALWHPARADEYEVAAWRRKLTARRLRQPLRQVFREHYSVLGDESQDSETRMFSGRVLDIHTLIGLSRKEGWAIDHGGLVREFGNVRATFDVGAELFPGLKGACIAGSLRFHRRHGRQWHTSVMADIDAVVYSEVCRAADLLVSVSSFALDDTAMLPERDVLSRWRRLDRLSSAPLSAMAQMRRTVLELVFDPQISQGRMNIVGNHLTIGEHAVHMATALTTYRGALVEVGPPPAGSRLSAIPWLPYDEVLLKRLVEIARSLLESS